MTRDENGSFEQQRALTAHFREALGAFSEDARRIVQEEIATSRPDPGEIETLIRRVAREELAGAVGRRTAGVSWSTAAVAAVLTLATLGTGWGVAALVGSPRSEATVETAEAALVTPARASDVAEAETLATATRYDSLFAGRDPLFLVLAGRVANEASPGVTAALSAWRSGDTSADPVVHNALVQFALREVVDSTISIDGSILRSPICRGHSCNALIAHWRAQAGGAGYPALSPEPAADSLGLAVVERLLVLGIGAAQ